MFGNILISQGENTHYVGILKNIANSNETIVRFQGRERNYD